MPRELSEYNTWKEFPWKESNSAKDLKKYIELHLQGRLKTPEQAELDSLKHDLAIRADYEQTCEKVQEELKSILQIAGVEVSVPGEMLPFNRAVKENLEKLKPAMEKWLEQELQTERASTQQALQTSQTWHERQKAEIIAEWKVKVFQLKAKLTNLLNTRKQKITQELQLIREVLNE